ncbi:MFS transporter [Paraglaciecola sp. T6c]|uniref:MFS transporter n=1 Tax=Pseudoalteromonas atlantica (strain T6c / ATCC BAA-1087) TaxID=3042615 RepID=UPI0002E7B71E|nr:MFS transporter [Paraglaciecola sp. T6c]
MTAMISCHVAGLFFLPMMPLVMGAFVSDFSAQTLSLGSIASIQLTTTALGAFSFTIIGARTSCRRIVLAAIASELLLNAATLVSSSFSELIVLRGASGFAQGHLLAAAGACAALSRRTEKTFAFYNATLAIFAVVFLFVGALVVPLFGHAGVFVLFVVVDTLALAFIYFGLPDFTLQARQASSSARATPLTRAGTYAFIALILFGVALSGTQTFIERLGYWHGAALNVIATSLGWGWCIAIVAPFLLIWLIGRCKDNLVLLLPAYTLIVGLTIILSLMQTTFIYLVAVALFTPLIMFIEPLQFGVLGQLDDTGRLAALGPGAISIGSGLGPLILSSVVNAFGLISVGITAGCLLMISFLFLYPVCIKANKNVFKKQ